MAKTQGISRRSFIQRTGAAALAATAGPGFAARGATNGGGKYRTALIGCGWWGGNILRVALESGKCRVTGLCDVDENALTSMADDVSGWTNDEPKRFRDYRELLEEEPPDIAIVATPDHWHALNTVDALKAGAHVFVEKPIGHTIHEGSAMVKAARETERVVQVGTHRRVSPHNLSAIDFLRNGGAGKIGMVRAFVHYPGGPEQPEPNTDPPDGLDWDAWCGPAPLRPFNPRIHPRGFRHFLDYANGQLGDWGIHWIDQILMWTDELYPKRVFSTGGRHIRGEPVFTDEAQTTDAPDTQVASFEFEDFTFVWEHRQYAANEPENHSIGCYFYGTEGVAHLGWLDGWTFYPLDSGKEKIHEEPQLHQPDSQNIPELWDDFLESIEENRKPASDIEHGHRATNMSLLGMISLKLGRSLEWDGAKEEIVNDPEANRCLRRDYRGDWTFPEV